MKRILFLLLLPFLPYLATAQVAKDTVTVLTIADIPAGAIRDTTNLTFVQDNAFAKATFDSLYKYTRVKLLATGAITSAELATALSNETGTGAAVFGTNPTITGATISGGSINNTPIGASTANTGAFTTLTTTSTINLITVGRGAGALQTNTALGLNALSANTTANFNTAIGNNALQLNTTGGTNTAIGYQALRDNTTGAGNTAIGSNALRENESGGSNMAIGSSALLNNTTGNNNVAIGVSALTLNTTGNANMAIGLLALSDNTIGENNTAIGANALDATTGSNNTAIGRSAGANITSGTGNLILGNSVNAPSATDNNQVVIKNIIFATGAEGSGTNIAGNVGIGVNNPASRLVVKGIGATDGTTAFNVTNSNNISMFSVKDGGLVSANSLSLTTPLPVSSGGTGRTTYDSLGIVFASSTTGLKTDTRLKYENGTLELREAMNISDGSGTITGRFVTTSSLGNAAIFGTSTAHNLVFRTNNTMRIFVEHLTANVGIGTGFNGTTVLPTERLHVVGNARITAMNGINDIGASATGVLQAATSDYNLKNSIQDSDFGLNHILRLKPVTFLYNDQDRKIHSEIPEIGFIAQDVNDVIPNAVSPTGEGTLQLDYRAITATLTKAIQEQQAQIEALKQRITQLENK